MSTSMQNAHNLDASQRLFNDYLKVSFQQLSCAIKQCAEESKSTATKDIRRVVDSLQQSEHQNQLIKTTWEAYSKNKEMLNPVGIIPSPSNFKTAQLNYTLDEQRVIPRAWFYEAEKTKTLAYDCPTIWSIDRRSSTPVGNVAHLAHQTTMAQESLAAENGTFNCIDNYELEKEEKSSKVDTFAQKPQLQEQPNENKNSSNSLDSETPSINIGEYENKMLNRKEFDKQEKNVNLTEKIDENVLDSSENVRQAEKLYTKERNFWSTSSCSFCSSGLDSDYKDFKKCETCLKNNTVEENSDLPNHGAFTTKFCDPLKGANELKENAELSSKDEFFNVKYDSDDIVEGLKFYDRNVFPSNDLRNPIFESNYFNNGLLDENGYEFRSSLLGRMLEEYASMQQPADLEHSADISIDERDLESKIFLPREVLQSIME